MPKTMSIGQLAEAAGVSVETVRYYQRRGLLDIPAKPLRGQRRYSDLALERLAFIRNAQKLAFSLEEVTRLLAMADDRRCTKVRAIAREKLLRLGERVSEINRIRRQLRLLIKRCDGSVRGAAGPTILSLIAGHAAPAGARLKRA